MLSRTDRHRFQPFAVDTAGATAIGSNGQLGGGVFDPFDIPFLPDWPADVPAFTSRFQSIRGEQPCQEEVFPNSERGFPRVK